MQNNLALNETYFSFCCTIPAELVELWNWFCFEKGALGTETLQESSLESRLKIFYPKKPDGGAQKLFECFQSELNAKLEIIIHEEGSHPVENWQANWREHFHPVKVGQSLIILPSWKTEIELSGRHPVWIDPGQGFGTGHHLSTALALEMLEQYLFETDTLPESMLDLGTGSGILAIAACRLGIKKVTGLDIEAEAVAEVERNCELNGLSGRIFGHVGQPSFLKKPAPLVISNMLLSELLDIRLDLIRLTSPGGTLICSGLFGKQEEELRNSLTEMGFVYRASLERENWNSIQFQRFSKKS